jgi:SAM-dependent methyltransferase
VSFASPLGDYLYPVHKLMEQAARRHVADLRGRVLDLGCGASPFRRFLPRDAEYFGVDAREHASAAVRAAAEALPFADGAFDGAMCTEMICFSAQPWLVVAELARVIRKGGLLYVTAPFGWHVMDGPDYFRFTPRGIRALLESCGFSIETMEPIGGMFSSTTGELIEAVVADAWLPMTRALGIRRGGYRAAALLTAPLNLATRAMAPLLDRVMPRKPLSIAVRARR